MAWIELHQSLWTHKKTVIMAAMLDIDELYAAAHMSKLWTWALDNASDGNLSKLPNRVIAFGAGWKGDADQFVEALIQAGWLDSSDQTTQLHDWYDYAGRLIEKKNSNKERMRNARATNVQRTNNARSGATIPNHTLPNAAATTREEESEPKSPEQPETAAAAAELNFYNEFHRIYRFYPTDMQIQVLETYITDGMEEAVVVRAIERAATNGTGFKFGLITKILNDYVASKVKTLAEAVASDEAYDAAKARGDPPKTGRGSRYQQEVDELRREKEELRRASVGSS